MSKKAKAAATTAEPDEAALGQQVKDMRDAGKAWWVIGYELGLKGSADNVAQGKGGASRARALYKKAFGDYPKTQRMRKAPDESLAGTEGTHKRNHAGHEVVKATPGQSVFPDSITDEDLVAAVQGKQIAWDIYATNPRTGIREFAMTDTQVVHERVPVQVKRDAEGIRSITFREGQDNDVPLEYRGLPGKYRSVSVREIVKVAGTGRRVQTEEVVAAAAERAEVKKTRRASRKKVS